MNRQAIITGVVCAIIFGAAGYAFAGMHSSAPSNRFAQGGAGVQFAGRTGAGGARGGANAVFGTVISSDSNGITVQLGGPGATSTNGTASGTRIVLIDSSTQIQKMTTGSQSDLKAGTGVMVTGTSNSDGSLTATSVQIRPAGGR